MDWFDFVTTWACGALLVCIITVLRAKKTAGSDEELRMSLQKVVPFNMAALFLSAIGLMLVILGIML